MATIMRADLERLLISEAELFELTGFNHQQIMPSMQLTPRQIKFQRAIALGISGINFISFASIFVPPLRIAGIIFLIGLTLGVVSLAIEFVEVRNEK